MKNTNPQRLRSGLFGIATAVTLLCGCAGPQVRDFESVPPQFDPIQFFEGRADAWGVLEDGSGNPTKRFTSTDQGVRQGPAVTISQTIRYSDGTEQKRSWTLTRIDAHHFQSTANDIVGTATGEAYGNALHLDYTIALSPTNPLTHVHLNQWLYLQQSGQDLISRTTITKLGVVAARSSEFVHRTMNTSAP